MLVIFSFNDCDDHGDSYNFVVQILYMPVETGVNTLKKVSSSSSSSSSVLCIRISVVLVELSISVCMLC